MPRKADPDARKNLLNAARTAFAEVGVDAARIEDIARAAGVSKGSFYLHFASKDAAFEELVQAFFAVVSDLAVQRHEAHRELEEAIGRMTPEDWRDGTARAQAFAELEHTHTVRALQAMWRHRDVLRCILEQGTGERVALLARLMEMARTMLSAQFQVPMCSGAFRADLDPDLVSELVLGMYLQLARRMTRLTQKPDFPVWARTVDTLMVEGLAARTRLVADPSVSQEAS